MSSPDRPFLSCISHWRCAIGLFSAWPALACAAETAGAAGAVGVVTSPGVSISTMLQTFAGLALILALFVGAAWLAKRLGVGNALTTGHGPMRVIGGLSLSPRERILLVEIDDTWLLVGLVPGQIRTLHTMPKGVIPEAAVNDPGFGQWLRHFREKNPDATR